jgi:hypothetical protein
MFTAGAFGLPGGLYRKIAETDVVADDWDAYPSTAVINNIVQNIVSGYVYTTANFPAARYSLSENVTALQLVDFGVLTRKVSGVRWLVTVSAGTSVEQYELQAVHNGTSSASATVCAPAGPFSVLRLGQAIPGVKFTPALTGSGASQKIVLMAGADTSATFKVRMEWTQHSTAPLTLAELEG